MRLIQPLMPFVYTCVICLTAAFSVTDAYAQGNLLATPVRVVFDGTDRIQELNLANTGKDTARYLISFIEIRMNPDGTFEQISQPDSGQHFASSNLRFFPRSVVLPPNEAQVVKLQLVKTGQLSPGEYRSHLYFRAEPGYRGAEEDVTLADTAGISVKLVPVFGISIPVIIRTGEVNARVSVSGLSLQNAENGTPTLHMVFTRMGNASVYGNITVNHISAKGKVTKVAAVNGMAVYTPNLTRRFRMNLENIPGVNYHEGKLQVTYTAPKEMAAATTLAQAEVQL